MFRKFAAGLDFSRFSDSGREWLTTSLFLPLILFLRFIHGTWLVQDKDFISYSRSAVLLGLIVFAWLSWKWMFDDRFITTGLELYFGGFCLAMVASTIFSEHVSLSVEKLIGAAGYLIPIYILLDLRRSEALWQGLVNALLLTAGISSLIILLPVFFWIDIYGITAAQVLTDPAYALSAIPRLPNFINFNASETAALVVIILPLALFQFSKAKTRLWKIILASILLLNTAVFILTQSRGGLLGLAGLIGAAAIVYWQSIRDYLRKNKTRSILVVSLAAVLLIGISGLVAGTRGFDLLGSTLLTRYQAWLASVKMIRENPLLGSGLGTFGIKYLAFRDPSISPNTMIHAHNQVLQIAAELGLLGLISLGLILYQAARKIFQQGRLSAPTKMGLIALAGLFGTLIPDALFTSSMIVLVFMIYMVWLLPGQNHPVGKSQRIRTLGSVSLLAIVVGCGVFYLIWKIQPYHQALLAAENENWELASRELRLAQERDPKNPYYQHALGFTTGQAACQSGDRFAEAAAHYQRSSAAYSGWGIDYANAAALHAQRLDFEKAAQQMELAVQYRPQAGFFYCLLGDYYRQLDQPQRALISYGECIAKNPEYLDSPYWQEQDDRKNLIPGVIQEAKKVLAAGDSPEQSIRLARLEHAAGDLQEASGIILAYLAGEPSSLAGNLAYIDILITSGDQARASAIIEALLVKSPRSAELWELKGRLALENGQAAIAEETLELSYRLNPSLSRAWFLGRAYQSQGKMDQALVMYEIALDDPPASSQVTKFSRHVAGRWPLGGVYLDCLPQIRTYQDYFDPGLDAAAGLREIDCAQAACVYAGLLTKVPTAAEAQEQLDSLPCAGENDFNECFKREAE